MVGCIRVCLNPGGQNLSRQIIFITEAFEPIECIMIALFSENKLFISINVKEQLRKGSQILQFRAHFCRNCKFLFLYMERVPGGIFWPKTHSDTHLEHPEKVVSLTERGRKRVKEWRQATFMKEGMKALEKTRILAPADLRYLFSFPRYGRLKLTFLPDQFLHSKI